VGHTYYLKIKGNSFFNGKCNSFKLSLMTFLKSLDLFHQKNFIEIFL
jgi:hypothetical protein